MHRRNVRCVLALAVAVGAVGMSGATPSDARGAVSPVVRACASGRLPRDILDGRIAPPNDPLRTVEVTAPAAKLQLAVADTESDREFGLMCVTRLRARHGMIFVFAGERDQEFWMKDTLVPLDMVWLRADGEVTKIAANVPAVTLATPEAVLPRRRGLGTYVIELAAGEARADGITVGSQLVLPALEAAR